ncbi:MAG: DUF3365 domain-containing protein [Gammaproteobacteria bacterium]|nr:DUF3365 domain-containing protein [Gammaproteobacteria bacterium]
MNYRIIITIFALFSLISIAMIVHTRTIQENAVISSGIQSAKLYSNAISTFRTIYTSEVVAIAEDNGLPVSHNYKNKNGIPLPATLTIILGNKIGESGVGEKVSLYSPYPFPWRKKTGGLRDEFSKKAWAYLSENKTEPYFEIITKNNNKLLRYATADIMRANCINCHNSHTESPKTNWKTGDVRGVVDITIPLSDILTDTENDLAFTILIYAVLAFLGILGFAFMMSKHNNESKELENAVKIRTIELEQEKLKAIEANNAKSEFLSRMSHELRTPMNAVLGFSQLIKLDAKTEIEKDNCNEIISAGNHLLELINEVLDLAKIESGNLDIILKPVDIDNVIGDTLKLVAPLSKDKGIHISEYIATGFYVYADKTRLKQILLNLVSNAIKYNSDNGSVKVSVTSQENGIIRINIIDTGSGLNEDQLRDLFIPFNRLGAEHGGVDGIGIGLVISKQLTEAMNGKIGVVSTPNKGCTFWIELKSTMVSE